MSQSPTGQLSKNFRRLAMASLLACGTHVAWAQEGESPSQTSNSQTPESTKDPLGNKYSGLNWDFDVDEVELNHYFNPHTLVSAYVKADVSGTSFDGLAQGVRAYHHWNHNILFFGGYERSQGESQVNVGFAYEDVNYDYSLSRHPVFLNRTYFGAETAYNFHSESTIKIQYTYEHDYSETARRLFGSFGNNMSREYGVFVKGYSDWDAGVTFGLLKPLHLKIGDNRQLTWRVGVIGEYSVDEGWNTKFVIRKGRSLNGNISFSQPRL